MYEYQPATHLPTSSANADEEPSALDDRPRSGDREGSVSGSESTGYGNYMTGSRDDVDVPEDPHLALTSQTLNADGTPKRPMNAFMIFARKRRPQISAANQMMRTGDISKILSKEWNSMEMADKKFYLDQAKKLKDNFNSKYPDYIYRRRPNNSRKKKKVEAEQQSPTESSIAADTEESMEESSPIDVEDSAREQPTSSFQFRPAASSTATYESGDGYLLTQNTAGYPSVSEYGSGQYNQSSRISGLHAQESSLSATTVAPLRIPTLDAGAGAHPYSYVPPHSHTSSQSPLTAPNQGNQSLWDSSRPSRQEQVRSSSWTLPALDINLARQRSGTMSTASARSEAFSPNVPNRQWSNSASSATSSSSGSTPFPTLASPFYPTQSPSQRSADLAHSPTSHPGGSSEYFTSSPTFQRSVPSATRHGAGQDQGNYSSSPTVSSHHSSSSYSSQWPYPRPGSTTQQRLPALQPVSSYSLQPPSASSGSPPSAHSTYWERSRYEGRQ